MTEQIEGQAQKGKEQPPVEKKPGFDELYAKGWETIEADEAGEAGGGEAPKTPMQKLKEEPECPECPGGKFYRVIKHNGKDVGIKTEKEYNDYVQQGFDYTKKTQTLAEERRQLQLEREAFLKERDGLAARLDRLERGMPPATDKGNGKDRPAEIPPAEQPPTEAKIFEEFGLDPEYASDFEKKLVKSVVQNRQENQQLKELNQMFFLKEMTKNISGALEDAVKEFPVEDILDEKGESLTGQRVIAAFQEIVKDPAYQKTPVRDLAKMAVKRIHDAQQAAKGAPEGLDEEKTSVEDFAKKFPKLFAKIMKAGGREGVEEFLESQDDLPPTISSRKGDVPATSKDKGKAKFTGLDDAIEKGMDDPEIAALFGR